MERGRKFIQPVRVEPRFPEFPPAYHNNLSSICAGLEKGDNWEDLKDAGPLRSTTDPAQSAPVLLWPQSPGPWLF